MKQRLLCFFMLGILLIGSAYAQERRISGKVISSDDATPLPGVSVTVANSNVGTQTDQNGNFSLVVPEDTRSLSFTFVGYLSQTVTITSDTGLEIALMQSNAQLDEVVITGAYGIKQTARSVSYNAQNVSGEKLNVIRQQDFNSALAGKIAGVQIRSQSFAALGRDTEVRLRGASGFGTGGGALYVVDGTILPSIQDINLDDVEDISILQGPAASAQFGSQGANGAIVITLKKGRSSDGLGITVNLGSQFENVNMLPNYQNAYAGGASRDLIQYNWKPGDPEEWQALDGKYYHDYSDDASWGPRMVGQEYIPWYAWYGGTKYSYKTATLNPQPNNGRDFFNTGMLLNNSISFTQATDRLHFRFSYGNQNVRGLIPNSSLQKNNINLVSSYDLTDRFTVSANITYNNRVLNGEIVDDYSNQSTGSFNQWFHRDLDMGIVKELRGLTTEDGIYASWNKANPASYNSANPRNFYAANYWYNFYTYYDLIDMVNQRDRLYGSVSLSYKVNENLNFTGTYRKQQNTTFYETKYSSDLNYSGLQTTGNNALAKGFYGTGNTYSNRRNIEVIGNYSKQFQDFSVDASVGVDFFKWVSKSNSAATNNGLTIDNLFTVNNSVDDPSYGNGRTTEAYNAIFAKLTLGYSNYLFLNGSLRNDWFSTLPEAKNNVMSKSFGASFIFKEFLTDLPWLSNGKVRVSWGEIPKALGTSTETFGAYRYPGNAYGVFANKWNGNLLMNNPTGLVDPDIQGSVVTQKEIGLDLGFFNNRLSLAATLWNGDEVNFPYSLSLNGASGYSTLLTNIGKIAKSGAEFQLGGIPVRLRNFTWNINATWAPLWKNDVVELSEKYDITRTPGIGGVWGTTMPYMLHQVGMRWGQLFGNGMKRIDGKPVLTDDGMYVNDNSVYFGSVLPKHTGGLQNNFTIYEDFTLSANIDWQLGGKFLSLSNMWGSFSGLTARTAGANDKGNPIRDAVADGGGVHVFGVNADGADVDYYVEAQDYFQGMYSSLVFDDYIYDLTFVKLRELSVGYNIPVRKWRLPTAIKRANFALVARNPLLIYAKTKDFDPSEVDAVYGETGQLPGTRGIGFNLNISF